jgi:hypothetical protein
VSEPQPAVAEPAPARCAGPPSWAWTASLPVAVVVGVLLAAAGVAT